ncbi:MAG TPA: rubrerythrin family protein [Candidatus Lokiarchaeia archaeon]|nr:rubrerythrin family protein [Candidatus Lokiarchaeia archaeon]
MDAKTLKDLKDAFAGESQANRRYLAFSKKAADENLPGVALLFKAIAEAETIHALRHFNLFGVESTLENLKAAAKGENYEVTTMYPGFIKDAAKEKAASMSFNGALQAEKEHEKLYLDAILQVSEGEDIDVQKVSVCPVCGYTVIGDAPDECPICKAKQEAFIEVS